LDAGNADLDSTTKHRSSADQDRLIGMLALATVVLVAAGLIALFAIPPPRLRARTTYRRVGSTT
jgi:hypothetical protein